MSSRDIAVLESVKRRPGGDYANVRSEYEARTGRRLSTSAAIGALRRLRELGHIQAEARVRQAPIFYPIGRGAAS